MEISVCYIDEKLAMEAALNDDAKLPNAIKKMQCYLYQSMRRQVLDCFQERQGHV